MPRNTITRRGVLSAATAGSAGLLFGGTAEARNGPPARIVGVASRDAEREARRRAESVKRMLDFGDVGQAVAGRFSDEAARKLRRRDDVRYVEEDGQMHAVAQTLPWGVDRVDADVLHTNGGTGNGADVAIIDSGIDDDHPDLRANVGDGVAFVDCKGSNCNYAWSDDNDHGTHCAGIADAVDNSLGVVGVSTDATLHAVKVLDRRGSGSFSDVAAGIEYTADRGWDVGSLSLGASSGSQTVKDACRYAYNNGVLLVAAAGNDGPCTDCVGYPAAYEECIAVSSTDEDDSLSGFSSTGPEVELAAPGGSVYSTVIGGYDTFSGTSMACPHVTGAAGQLMANGYTNTEARDRLTATAEDIGLGDVEQGNGLLDAEAAVLDGNSGSDSAPTVSWVTPSDGETVSGTVTVQIDASDSEDGDGSLDVTYTVDGGTSRSTSYNSTSGYYEDSWDTTDVSDGDHALEASATDSAGNAGSSNITVATDNTDEAPAVESLSVTEVETSDGDAEFDVEWSVSDSDDDLAGVDLSLTDDTDGESEDSAVVSVSGGSASGTTRLVAAGDDGSGNSYTVEATVSDSNGTTGSDSTSVGETENTNSAPSASIDSLNDRSNPRWDRYEVDWSASDSDGNLDTVVVELLDSGGTSLDSVTNDVSGSSASRLDEVRSKSSADEIVVTATDTDGAAGSDSLSI